MLPKWANEFPASWNLGRGQATGLCREMARQVNLSVQLLPSLAGAGVPPSRTHSKVQVVPRSSCQTPGSQGIGCGKEATEPLPFVPTGTLRLATGK